MKQMVFLGFAGYPCKPRSPHDECFAARGNATVAEAVACLSDDEDYAVHYFCLVLHIAMARL